MTVALYKCTFTITITIIIIIIIIIINSSSSSSMYFKASFVCCVVRRHQLLGVESLPSDIGPVVDAYEHALLASFPRPRYLVGCDAILMAILAKLPEFIGDWVLAKRAVPNCVVP